MDNQCWGFLSKNWDMNKASKKKEADEGGERRVADEAVLIYNSRETRAVTSAALLPGSDQVL